MAKKWLFFNKNYVNFSGILCHFHKSKYHKSVVNIIKAN